MSTLNVDTLNDRLGTGQPDIDGLAKAWVNFDGTGTVSIRDSFNVSSITDNGAGNYTANFINALPNANYCAKVSHIPDLTANTTGSHRQSEIATLATSSVQVYTFARSESSGAPTKADFPTVCVSIHAN